MRTYTRDDTKIRSPGRMSRSNAPAPGRTKGTARGKTPARAQVPWITHTGVSYEGLWNVQMPTKPKHTTEPGLFGVKVRNVHVASDSKLTYTLKIQVTPDDALNQGKERSWRRPATSSPKKCAARSSGSSTPRSPVTRGTPIGSRWPVPSPLVVAARAAIVGKRTVVLSVIGDRAAVAGPYAERFLDSFRVGN